MLRLIGIVFLAFAIGLPAAALPAAAQTCWVAPGQYVDTIVGEGVAAGLVMNVAGTPCWADVRLLALPGEPFDPYSRSFYEDQLEPLLEPPPYDKPNGCPYAAGEAVDLKDQYDVWYPATVASADANCSYQVDYQVGAVTKSFGAYHDDLRLPLLPRPTAEELAVLQEEVEANKLCPPGGLAADSPGDDVEAMVKRGVIAEIAANLGDDNASVSWDKLRAGETMVAVPGSVYEARTPDAASNATIYPYRMEVTVCVPGEPERTISRFALDYSCYEDRFGDFTCRRDKGRPID